VELRDFHVEGVAMVATMALPGREKGQGFFGTLSVHAPFFGPRDEHRCVEGLRLFTCLGCHIRISDESLKK
jgi:hypothetical protein